MVPPSRWSSLFWSGRRILLFLTICQTGLLGYSWGYSTGAPNGSCDNLTPSGHGVDFSQPYTNIFTISRTTIDNNTIAVTIAGKNVTNDLILGFLLESRFPNNNSYSKLGWFNVTTSPNLQPACNNNAVTHKQILNVPSISVIWNRSTSYPIGEVRFVATAVRQKSLFWSLEEASYLSDVSRTNCGISKSCFTFGCNSMTAHCQQVVTWSDGGSYVNFEFASDLNAGDKYAAIGLSTDDHMGNDSVTSCMLNSNNSVVVFMSWNIPRADNNGPIENPLASLVPNKQSGGIFNRRMVCRFSRYKTGNVTSQMFYPNAAYYLLLATGDVINNTIQTHSLDPRPTVSTQALDFTNFTINTTGIISLDGPPSGGGGGGGATSLQPIIAQCGFTKSCFLPYCDPTLQSCDRIVTWSNGSNGNIVFELAANLSSDNNYLALGLSDDDLMGNDSVVACVNTVNGVVIYFGTTTGYTYAKSSDQSILLSTLNGTYSNGRMSCTFGYKKPLSTSYFQFIANGMGDASSLQKHPQYPTASKYALNLTQFNNIYLTVLLPDMTKCGISKSCYSVKCNASSYCSQVVTWSDRGSYVNFEFASDLNSGDKYAALGFSQDNQMGSDSVVACMLNSKNVVVVAMSWNEDKNNVPLSNSYGAIVPGSQSGMIVNGRMMCRFSMYKSGTQISQIYYPNQPYFILLANGPVVNNTIQQHLTYPTASNQALDFTKFNLYDGITPGIPYDVNISQCGISKGCFTVNCNNATNQCRQVVTWSDGGSYVSFELASDLNANEKYAALGLSTDTLMGNDSVTACMLSSNNTVVIGMSWNIDNEHNVALSDPSVSLVPNMQSGAIVNGRMICRFSRYKSGTLNSQILYPNQAFNLLVVSGPVINNMIQEHGFNPFPSASRQALDLSAFNQVNGVVPGSISDVDRSQCGISKSCFQVGCNSSYCRQVVTWSDGGSYVNFEFASDLNAGDKYAAIGLSTDDQMGADSVTACWINSNNTLSIGMSWNVDSEINANAPLFDPSVSLVPNMQSGAIVNGRMICRFSRYKSGTLNSQILYPNQTYFLLLATGPVSSNAIQRHTNRLASSQAIDLTKFNLYNGTAAQNVTGIDFSNCGKSKSCFAPNCVDSTYLTCDKVVTWSNDQTNNAVKIELAGNLTAKDNYLALGLSFDQKMGDDSVVACVYTSNGVIVYFGHTSGYSYYKGADADQTVLVQPITGSVIGNRMFCTFEYKKSSTSRKKKKVPTATLR